MLTLILGLGLGFGLGYVWGALFSVSKPANKKAANKKTIANSRNRYHKWLGEYLDRVN